MYILMIYNPLFYGAYPFMTREKALEGERLILNKYPHTNHVIERFIEIIDDKTLEDIKKDLKKISQKSN